MTKKILSPQELTEEIASLQEKLERLLPVWTRLGDIEDRLTVLETPQSNGEIERLEELVETYRQNQAQCNCNIEYQVKALQEKVEGLEDRQEDHGACTHQDVEDRTARLESRSFEANKRLDDLERTHAKNINVLQRRQDTHSARLSRLEPPNQSDCPLGHTYLEGKGYWLRPYESKGVGNEFEECGECPKKKDERAETIRRARSIIQELHQDQCPPNNVAYDYINEALDIAEQSTQRGE